MSDASGSSILPGWLAGLFGTGSGAPRETGGEVSPAVRLEERLERLEQFRSGLGRARAALPEARQELGRRCDETAGEVAEAGRALARRAARAAEGPGDRTAREARELIDRAAEAVRQVHFQLVRLEVDREWREEEENEAIARAAAEARSEAASLVDELEEAAEAAGAEGASGREAGA